MTAIFDLPNINGAYEVGIAVGVDPSLPDNHKLPILANVNISRAAGYAAAWAASIFSSNPPEVRNLYSSAAAGIVLAGLAETVGGRPDGDWILKEQMDPTITEAAPAEAVTQDAIIKALSIVIATKANLYMMNHHTGQGPLSGYARKVALVQHPEWLENDSAVVTAIHTVGHWASSIGIFSVAGVPAVKAVSGPTYTKTINVVLSHDARLRFAGMPAGTARHSIAYEGAKRLVRNMLGQLCPGIADFSVLPTSKDSFKTAVEFYSSEPLKSSEFIDSPVLKSPANTGLEDNTDILLKWTFGEVENVPSIRVAYNIQA